MTYLHSQDVTHRDLKTANILIGADWSLQITDFARSKAGVISAKSNPTSRVGTVGYMAPELISVGVGGKYTRKVDVWSFGVILWELCTRCVPYKGLSETEISSRIVDGELSLPEPVAFPTEIHTFIKQCVSFDAKDRPSFADIKDELWAKASSVIGNNPEIWLDMATECHAYAKNNRYSSTRTHVRVGDNLSHKTSGPAANTIIGGGSDKTLKLHETPILDSKKIASTSQQKNEANIPLAPRTSSANKHTVVQKIPSPSTGVPLRPDRAASQAKMAWDWTT